MRVKPRPSLAFAIGIGYGLLFLVLELVVNVDYDKVGDNTHNIIRAIVIPLAIGSTILAVLTTALGWWRPVLREQPSDPPKPPRWMLAIPILVLAVGLVGIPYGHLGDLGASYLLWLALGTLMVGFSEEITYRGLAVVGFRGGYSEVRVWLWSSILFGLLHGINVVLGQGAVMTVRQVVLAFVIGSIFYAVRRTTGAIIVAMVLHGLWDFSTFSHAAATGGSSAGTATDVGTTGIGLVQSLLMLAMVVLFIIGAKRLLSAKTTAPAIIEPQGS